MFRSTLTLRVFARIETARRRFLHTVRVLAGILLTATVATATTLPYKDLSQLAGECDGIIVGTVEETKAYYTADKDIYTLVTFTDLTLLHGRYTASSITIKVAGGEIDGDVLEVHGAPRFKPKERVLLFVRENGKALVPFVGWTQGVFRLAGDEASGHEVVSDYHGNRVLGVEGNTVVQERRYSGDAFIMKDRGFSPGTTDDGSATGIVRPPRSAAKGTALSFADFREAIARKFRSRGTRPRPLTSVSEPSATDSREPEWRRRDGQSSSRF